jgi:predicted ATPase/class 3 adenylate cyclase
MTPPTGTVTFLFTDIEGSTRQAQVDAAAWSAARARHHAIVRGAIEANGGFVFLVVGDAFCAAFSNAASALAAALSAQRGLRQEPWAGPPVTVRMGLHTGHADWRDTDYEGYLTLARVERIMSAGHGGQVLLSQTAADLARPELQAGAAMRDLGEHHLKDITEPEHLFQLLAPDLPAEFPPLRSVETVRNNLPAQLTSFVGRETELSELKTLLSSQRLVTLTGPGGTGKTRLALKLAAEVLESFAGGAWLVELAPVSDPELVTRAVATALRVRDQPGRLILDALTDYLRSTTLLLVLDNCEHMIETCAGLADGLLHAAPNLKVVATSRETLGIGGETVFRVPSLPVPDLRGSPDMALLAEIDSVRLFVDRATSADPHFRLTEQNAPAVAQIAVRLDGIPLAIELAAARTTTFTPQQIEARLDNRFLLLTGGSRTALERHQTLQALIDWSHDLLTEPERVLLRRLSVFAGGWSLDAAQAVCGEGLGDDVLETLVRLSDRSLVAVDELRQSGERRQHLLETIRQYARDRLLEAGESKHIRDRHLTFFLRLAEDAEPRLRGTEQLVWLDRLETEHDNLRAALAWALETGNDDASIRMPAALAYFWEFRGHWGDGQKWLDTALGLDTPDPAQRAKVLYSAARLRFAIAYDVPASRAMLEQSLSVWREIGNPWWIAVTLEQLGFMLLIGGDRDSVREPLEEGIALARGLEDPWPSAILLVRLAAAVGVTDVPASIPIREEGIAFARRAGDKSVLNQALTGLAGMHLMLGDLASATSAGEEALALARSIGSATHVFLSFLLLTVAACLQGDIARARDRCRALLAYARDNGIGPTHPFVIFPFGLVASFGGQPRRGVELISAVQVWSTRTGVGLLQYAPLARVTAMAFERARADLDQASFDEAVREGQTLTPEQAVEIATAEDAEPPLAKVSKG